MERKYRKRVSQSGSSYGDKKENNKNALISELENKKLFYTAIFMITLVMIYILLPYNNRSEKRTVVTTSINVTDNNVEVINKPTETLIFMNKPVSNKNHIEESISDINNNVDGLKNEYPIYEKNINKNEIDLVSIDDPTSEFKEEEKNDSEDKIFENIEQQRDNDLDLFIDQAAYDAAPFIKVLPESKTRKYSRIVLAHERYYRNNPSKLYVPTLKKTSRLSLDEFMRIFMEKSQPVVIPFEAMRHIGNFSTKAGWTLNELKELYPNNVPALYKYGAIVKKDIDIGPAVASLIDNKKLKKTLVGKSYPRNTKFVLKSLKQLGLQEPPFIPKNFTMMLPSLWFASTAEATPLHSDCCDNWAMMCTGTKKWFLAPPSEARNLKPNCKGGLCWVKQLPHADMHAQTRSQKNLRDSTQFLEVDLPPGHVLYLPAGWFHHVEQEESTFMINFWSKEGPYFLNHLKQIKKNNYDTDRKDVADM